jgi:predicted nucleotidyltransferase
VSVKIPRSRFEEWIKVLRLVKDYAKLLHRRLGKITVILHGSFARGDFNLWSDIDLVIVSEKFNNVRILDRYDLLGEKPPMVEPILLTPREFIENLKKKSWIQALGRGAILVVDDYGLSRYLELVRIRVKNIDEFIEFVKELKQRYSV